MAMEATADGLWDWQLDTDEVFYSRSWLAILGEAAAEQTYHFWESRIHPDDKPEVLGALEKHLAGETKAWRCEHRLSTAEGDWKWVLGRGQVVEKSAEGRPLRMIGTMTDISTRVQALESLQESQERFRKLFLSSPIPTFVWHRFNGEFFLRDVNEAAKTLAVGGTDQFLGCSASEIYPDRPDIRQCFTDCHAEQRNIVMDTKYRSRGSGLIRQIVFTFVYISDQMVMLHTEDITAGRHAQEALRASEAKFRTVFEQAGGYCMILDPNTPDGIPLIVDANEAAYTAHGYTREEFIGRPVAMIDDEEGKRLVKEHTAKIMTGEPFRLENIHLRKDGSTFPVEVNAKRIDAEDGKSYILTTEYDISERRKAEQELRESKERFELAMDASEDGLFDWHLKSGEIYYSPGWKRMLGYQDHELPNDFSVWESLTRAEDAQRSWEMQRELVNRERDRFEIEFKMKHKNGHWVDILSRARALFDDTGEAIRIVGTHVDISEIRSLKKSLLQAQKMESIGNLAGGIAHDFNNILSSILGFTELALDAAPAGSSQREDLEEVYAAGNRAKELVKQILIFARQAEDKRIPVELGDIVTEALKLLRPSTPTTIDIRPAVSTSARVFGNPTQLHQLVMNLCTNAVHSLQDNGGVLDISLKDITLPSDSQPDMGELPAGAYLELTISDNGPGIDPEMKEKIFEPYFTTKEVGKGTGMGLAMVKGIVESCGGDIRVISEPGSDTSFVIRLPVATMDDHDELKSVKPPVAGSEHILFVDDEPPIAKMGSRVLTGLGYQVTVRTSSFEALELFKKKKDAFDLVITDMTMPSMTGDILSVEMRKIRPDIPIILCTGYSNRINEENAKQLGIDAFAYKPFTMVDLAKTVREVLDGNPSSSL